MKQYQRQIFYLILLTFLVTESTNGTRRLTKESNEKAKHDENDDCQTKDGGATTDPRKPTNRGKALNIAIEAAENAKAAEQAQNEEALKAAHEIKLELAERAMKAAQAAEAALEGKQEIVAQLLRDAKEAEIVVQVELNSMQLTEEMMKLALQLAINADKHVKDLEIVLAKAMSNLQLSQDAATAAKEWMAEKIEIVDAAKSRMAKLQSSLITARKDLEKMNNTAKKATCAAKNAKQKVDSNKQQNGGSAEKTAKKTV